MEAKTITLVDTTHTKIEADVSGDRVLLVKERGGETHHISLSLEQMELIVKEMKAHA